MPEHIQYEDNELFNPETHHEESDVPVRSLLWWIAIIIVFAVVAHVALWFLYKAFVVGERHRMLPADTALVRPESATVPQNQPLLQPFPQAAAQGEPAPPATDTPVADLAKMRESEQRALTSYGWVDQQKGIVRIPIDQAESLLLQRGVPTARPAAATPPPAGAISTTPAATPATGVAPAVKPAKPAVQSAPGGARP